jgi:hypothetical protein
MRAMSAPDALTFRFPEVVLGAAASRTRRRVFVSAGLVAAAAVALWAAVLRPRGSGPGAAVFSVALLLLLAFVSLRRRLRRLHARWASFEVTVWPDAVGRTVEGFPPVRIARADVASVGEVDAGVLVRDRGGNAVLVPREVEGYERARAVLAGWGGGAAR